MRKILSVIMTVLLVLSTLSFSMQYQIVLAEEGFLQGSGTAEDPYLISTAEELNRVRERLSAFYVLLNDISLAEYENWIPIGSEGIVFSGELDGNGYTISDMRSQDQNGVFGTIGKTMETVDESEIEHIGLIKNFPTDMSWDIPEEEMANPVNVRLLKSGGSGGSDNTESIRNGEMQDLDPPVREGFSFDGYYSLPEGNGTKYYTETGEHLGSWERMTGGILFANWIQNPTVTEKIQEDVLSDSINKGTVETMKETVAMTEPLVTIEEHAATDDGKEENNEEENNEEETYTLDESDMDLDAAGSDCIQEDVYLDYVVEKRWNPDTHTYEENKVGWRQSADYQENSKLVIVNQSENGSCVLYLLDADTLLEYEKIMEEHVKQTTEAKLITLVNHEMDHSNIEEIIDTSIGLDLDVESVGDQEYHKVGVIPSVSYE